MRTKLLLLALFAFNFSIGQSTSSDFTAEINLPNIPDVSSEAEIGANGFQFEVLGAGVNTKYSEFGSGFFMNKLIMVSSKKIGGLAKIDPKTNEAYKDLFCLDIEDNGQLSSPLLFSRILNTKDSEDQLTFSPDRKTVYFTRSSQENSLEYKLYKAELEQDSHGNWINQKLLSINDKNVSIETPYMSPKGDKLYFSSNRADSFGGYDIYVSEVMPDGSLGTPKNLGPNVNTASDEKYPALSLDSKYLYFSSKGHQNIGGYDVFISRILKTGYKAPRNLGNTINTRFDEVAYFLAARYKGYMSSNKPNGKGRHDIYTVTRNKVEQSLKGTVVDSETRIKLPNTLVIVKDEDGIEVARKLTDESGRFSFEVVPFENYTISTEKDGFINKTFNFFSSKGFDTVYNKNLELETTEPVIAEVDDKLAIVIENIYFDFNKWNLKEESHISMNKIVKVLTENPEMKLAINAHTDNKGSDSYNLKLSDRRAVSAVKYLIKNGISKNRLKSKGYGEREPIIDCKANCTDEELQANRRVEFIILD
ncbi:OmpA family protein [Hyunsoonleella sp. SJ7]|uniref:OmpA family protein n=1 Tax=Hyunsoonleella aquatilis TaxID=2762758 RepID=A0A923HDG6_9FLAO|nr:OmpA family protein [Hyunsoonleella aquatilis]MBC3758113.1 OmpA family protein [Hyunsoonleella aquatilis]